MPLTWSIVAVGLACAALLLLVVSLVRTARRTAAVLQAFRALLADRLGLLRARTAAVRVRLAPPAHVPASVASAGTTRGAPQ